MTAALLTVLGVSRYEQVRYHPAAEPDRWHETRYAPVATAALVGGIGEAILLLTDEARQMHGETCGAELAALGVPARFVPIPAGRSAEEIWEIFERIVGSVDQGAEVVLDITHSFRHLPFILFGSLTYLTALRGVRVRGVYYGAYDARSDRAVPVFDLGALLQLSHWYHAVRTFVETGHTRHLASLLREEAKAIFHRQGPAPRLQHLRAALDDLGWMIPTGLPIEAGRAARRGLTALRELREGPGPSAISRTVLDPLEEALAGIALPADVEDKRDVALDEAELRRQLRLARWYLEHGQEDRTLLLLREWVVNRCLLAAQGFSGRWLEYGQARQPMERALNALVERQSLAPSGSPQCESPLASLWRKIAERRNAIAHAGFKTEWIKEPHGVVEGLLQECERRCDGEAVWRTAPPGTAGRVLLTALGKSPGVLLTALRGLEPERALVVTSPEARGFVSEACQMAEWPTDRVTDFVVQDAHNCFGEVTRLLDWARPTLLEAREVLVNVTGGTTAMQYLAERAAGEAARLGIPTQRYALVDRREPEEQRREPYVLGECVPLRGDESGDEG
jgi:CRISPR-associated DxTHG motif protein